MWSARSGRDLAGARNVETERGPEHGEAAATPRGGPGHGTTGCGWRVSARHVRDRYLRSRDMCAVRCATDEVERGTRRCGRAVGGGASAPAAGMPAPTATCTAASVAANSARRGADCGSTWRESGVTPDSPFAAWISRRDGSPATSRRSPVGGVSACSTPPRAMPRRGVAGSHCAARADCVESARARRSRAVCGVSAVSPAATATRLAVAPAATAAGGAGIADLRRRAAAIDALPTWPPGSRRTGSAATSGASASLAARKMSAERHVGGAARDPGSSGSPARDTLGGDGSIAPRDRDGPGIQPAGPVGTGMPLSLNLPSYGSKPARRGMPTSSPHSPPPHDERHTLAILRRVCPHTPTVQPNARPTSYAIAP